MTQNPRSQQLDLIQDPSDRDRFILTEVDELEALLDTRITRSDNATKAEFTTLRAAINARFEALEHELKDRDDKTNKRITTMQGMLIGAMASTTAAMLVGIMNLVAGAS